MVGFIQHVATRVPLRAIVHGDFYALPAKIPHGPIVSARPMLNFTTMCTHSLPICAAPRSGRCSTLHTVCVACFLQCGGCALGITRLRLVLFFQSETRMSSCGRSPACLWVSTSHRSAMFVAIGRVSGGGHRLAAACHHRGHRAHGWVWGCQRGACALVGRGGTGMPSVGDGILRGGGGARLFRAPSRAPVLEARRILQPLGVYG